MMDEIKKRLNRIELEDDLVISLAVESGSRAWGFPSLDSDYDVRFIYVRPPDWYLSIDLESRRDVVEEPIEGVLDINGWDIRKALRLFLKSNPVLFEWLQSPIIYQEKHSLAARLRDLMPAFYSKRASFHHYLQMARGNFREHMKGEEVWMKKYFYLLRPLLAIRWIEMKSSVVPIGFECLVDETVEDPALREAIEKLLNAKKTGRELDKGPRIEALSSFVEKELERHEHNVPSFAAPDASIDVLNSLFRHSLTEAWIRK